MSKQNSWTDDEHGFLMETLDWPAKRVAEELGRSPQSIHTKRNRIKNGWKPRLPRWTVAEDEIILASGPYARAEDLAELLPGRAVKSIGWRRNYLGVVSAQSNEKRATTIGARPLLARSCRSCGMLLQANWFAFNHTRRVWSSECKRCASEKGVRYQAMNPSSIKKPSDFYTRVQALTKTQAESSYEPYTERDREILSDPDLTVLQKALKLKRSYAAVTAECRRSGYSSHYGLGDPERDQWMIENPNADRIEEITESLKRPALAGSLRPDFEWDD